MGDLPRLHGSFRRLQDPNTLDSDEVVPRLRPLNDRSNVLRFPFRVVEAPNDPGDAFKAPLNLPAPRLDHLIGLYDRLKADHTFNIFLGDQMPPK
jgi:hypothetical protein